MSVSSKDKRRLLHLASLKLLVGKQSSAILGLYLWNSGTLQKILGQNNQSPCPDSKLGPSNTLPFDSNILVRICV
jgi:hypothetical protein